MALPEMLYRGDEVLYELKTKKASDEYPSRVGL